MKDIEKTKVIYNDNFRGIIKIIDYTIEAETEKAWLLELKLDKIIQEWFPKSICEIDEDNEKILIVPLWLMQKKFCNKDIDLGTNLFCEESFIHINYDMYDEDPDHIIDPFFDDPIFPIF